MASFIIIDKDEETTSGFSYHFLRLADRYGDQLVVSSICKDGKVGAEDNYEGKGNHNNEEYDDLRSGLKNIRANFITHTNSTPCFIYILTRFLKDSDIDKINGILDILNNLTGTTPDMVNIVVLAYDLSRTNNVALLPNEDMLKQYVGLTEQRKWKVNIKTLYISNQDIRGGKMGYDDESSFCRMLYTWMQSQQSGKISIAVTNSFYSIGYSALVYDIEDIKEYFRAKAEIEWCNRRLGTNPYPTDPALNTKLTSGSLSYEDIDVKDPWIDNLSGIKDLRKSYYDTEYDYSRPLVENLDSVRKVLYSSAVYLDYFVAGYIRLKQEESDDISNDIDRLKSSINLLKQNPPVGYSAESLNEELRNLEIERSKRERDRDKLSSEIKKIEKSRETSLEDIVDFLQTHDVKNNEQDKAEYEKMVSCLESYFFSLATSEMRDNCLYAAKNGISKNEIKTETSIIPEQPAPKYGCLLSWWYRIVSPDKLEGIPERSVNRQVPVDDSAKIKEEFTKLCDFKKKCEWYETLCEQIERAEEIKNEKDSYVNGFVLKTTTHEKSLIDINKVKSFNPDFNNYLSACFNKTSYSGSKNKETIFEEKFFSPFKQKHEYLDWQSGTNEFANNNIPNINNDVLQQEIINLDKCSHILLAVNAGMLQSINKVHYLLTNNEKLDSQNDQSVVAGLNQSVGFSSTFICISEMRNKIVMFQLMGLDNPIGIIATNKTN